MMFAQPPVHVYQYQGMQWFNTSPEEPHETPVHEFNDKWEMNTVVIVGGDT